MIRPTKIVLAALAAFVLSLVSIGAIAAAPPIQAAAPTKIATVELA